MNKLHLLLLGVTLCVFSACHNDIWDAIDGLDSRVTKLEELCKEMNTNITSLQTIVDVLQANDYITSIVEIKKDGEVIGYTMTFGKHEPITIYHGQNGKDGADGKDGSTPVIGVAQDTDGVYYWTLNGEWLLDDNGNKLPVSGKDGQNGTNGSNGQDGQNGKDGITPQLKIEEGYWYISYDNGATWTQLGKAAGEDGADGADGKDGQNGADGKDGQDGDSMFQSVTQDENYVYFTLADGTVIKIVKGNGNSQSNDDFIFTITYDPNGGEGVMEKDTFYYGYAKAIRECEFAKQGYHFREWNTNIDGTGASYIEDYVLTIDKSITLYAQWHEYLGRENHHEYIDLGLSVNWATCNIGATNPENYGEYFAWGHIDESEYYGWFGDYRWCSGYSNTLTKYNTKSTSGSIVDNKTTLEITDDAAAANWGGDWRMPTNAEIAELYENCIWVLTTQNGVLGYKVQSKIKESSIFLPMAGAKSGTTLYNADYIGYYWSSSLDTDVPGNAWYIYLDSTDVSVRKTIRCNGNTIRPVCP